MRRLADLTSPELAALDRERTVVFVPISPLEEHGPHLPLGTDLYVAKALAERVGAELERRQPGILCLLVEPIPIGTGVIPMTGSIPVRPHVVHAVAYGAGRALARDGFRTIVAVSGHMGPAHLVALGIAAARISRRYGVAMLAPAAAIGRTALSGLAFAAMLDGLDPALSPAVRASLAHYHHGGMLETSVMLHVCPDQVRPEYRTLPDMSRLTAFAWYGHVPSALRHFQGYVGRPAQARADIGEAVVRALTAAAADYIERARARAVAQQTALRAGRRRALAFLGVVLGAQAGAGIVSVVARRIWRRSE